MPSHLISFQRKKIHPWGQDVFEFFADLDDRQVIERKFQQHMGEGEKE